MTYLRALKHRAVEFFSGIGGFAEAALGTDVSVVGAFDQSSTANYVYRQNFQFAPASRNLDAISAEEIPEAEIWWLSPPCTPFSRRGNRLDAQDPRAASFLNLIGLIEICRPEIVLIENVRGFAGSQVHHRLMAVLGAGQYRVSEYRLCSSDFGVPMKRPRHFVMATAQSKRLSNSQSPPAPIVIPLAAFIDEEADASLALDDELLKRYGSALNIVRKDQPDATLICFTSGYWKCVKASGSFYDESEGKIRRFSPREILRLLGFGPLFGFPADLDYAACWRLAGNSVDVRCVRFLLRELSLC